ncbi:hypothetical protein FDC50_08220 [Clostridium botulinum]|nr:hypothetical protein KU41_04110 [Clostridium botulinum]MBY6805158.1 hypothetical protein [Clostridium botulinum]MBY6815175.1 hypothetical protein [Clostridium botulinum]MBY6821797.1 hypothetical protein [Clostridium botulinum]NFJ52305.1 hypothetical protein [Clostridium botulinum]
MNLFNKNNAAKEGKELTISNLIKEISKLENENNLLNNKVNDQDKMLFSITQENALMDKHIKELENDLEGYYKIQDKKIEKYKDSYNEKMLYNALEKTTAERNLYKKTINKICNKFSIDYKEVFKIIDNINSKERER